MGAELPGQLVQVGEDSLWDALYQVVVQAQRVDADQQGDGLPGDVHQVVVAQVQVLQGLQEVLPEGRGLLMDQSQLHVTDIIRASGNRSSLLI